MESTTALKLLSGSTTGRVPERAVYALVFDQRLEVVINRRKSTADNIHRRVDDQRDDDQQDHNDDQSDDELQDQRPHGFETMLNDRIGITLNLFVEDNVVDHNAQESQSVPIRQQEVEQAFRAFKQGFDVHENSPFVVLPTICLVPDNRRLKLR